METLRNENFVRQLTKVQQSLLAFIMSMVGDFDIASDILQETNVVICEKYEGGIESFEAWAIQIARFQTLAWLRDRGRSRGVSDPLLLELIADEVSHVAERTSERRLALLACLNALPKPHREVIRLRYEENLSNEDVASRVSRTTGAVSQMLFRLRRNLARCVERRLERGAE
jgi:RNA polymerase sigma-70 factor (ECF subfamily)